MWDRPQSLSRVTDALHALAFVLALYAAVHFAAHLPLFQLREVRVTGPLTQLTEDGVADAVRRGVRGTFFTLDLARTRAAFEQQPWVRHVTLRRHWPDRLEVTLEEHVPLARWGRHALVNTHGEVFEAEYAGALPEFIGPEGSAKEIAIQYEYFRRSLAAVGLVPQSVQVSQRRAWQIRLDGGPTLELGREQIEVRLARFVATYGRLRERLERRIEHVDLRYPNGFAVRIPGLGNEKPARKGGRNAA